MDKPKPKIDIPALAGAKKEDKKIRYNFVFFLDNSYE